MFFVRIDIGIGNWSFIVKVMYIRICIYSLHYLRNKNLYATFHLLQ